MLNGNLKQTTVRQLFSRIAAMGAGLAALSSVSNAETFTAADVSFRDVTGTIEVKTTSGDEIDVEIRQGKTYRQITVEEKDGLVIISGERWKEDEGTDCCNTRINRQFIPRDGRELTTGEPLDEGMFADYPTIEISVPYEGNVEFVDARIKLAMERLGGALKLDACYVYGETSDVDEAVIGVVHGSRLVMGSVKSGLEIDVSGDADVRVADASMVDVDIAGPGDVVLGDIDGMLDVSIAGSGLVRATRVDGPMTARIAGSGAVLVKAGHADKLKAIVDGSGGVFFGGRVTQPDLRLNGSAEVRMDSVNGRINRSGSGSVFVGGEKVAK
ncbi:GIN domain-containing protein [Hyphococcus sp. DH-69]|uniref:GIN domain-containing protein n=1 Tax=Hyphococcus formosus TaxID=3143534 RepID=UPI00398B0342